LIIDKNENDIGAMGLVTIRFRGRYSEEIQAEQRD
jgi:hypothetical protein